MPKVRSGYILDDKIPVFYTKKAFDDYREKMKKEAEKLKDDAKWDNSYE